jgi:formylglycine-generating enzyme required for sulfatase activity
MFALTAVLLAYATWRIPTTPKRFAALLALPAVLLANYFLLKSYTGEPPFTFEYQRRVLERTVLEDRGYFEYSDKRERTGRSGRSGNASDGSSGMAGDEPEGLGARLASLMSAPPRRAMPGDVIRDCADCPEMVLLGTAYFTMGAAPGDEQASAVETPPIVVRVGRPFAIARTEITVGQYLVFVRETGAAAPACASSARAVAQDMPVTCLTWHEARGYAAWLSQRTNRSYRLPTEAEWEYAARGGASTAYAPGRTLAAGTANIGKANATVAAVASFPANGYGLNDMHGNVAELVGDCWVDTLRGRSRDSRTARQVRYCAARVLRDAGAAEPVERSRLSARRPIGMNERSETVGFRVVRDM